MAAQRPGTTINAWRPRVPGIAEVFHARFAEHAYPAHTHDTWDLMILDGGSVDFALDRHQHGVAAGSTVLLPPGVTHDGRSATPAGFRKRVLYLDTTVLPERLVGSAVDGPVLHDDLLRHRIHQLHVASAHPGDTFEAESRLALIRDRLHGHLDALRTGTRSSRSDRLAARLRELLDARIPVGMSLREAATILDAHPSHLVRCFTRSYGLPPHAYLTGRRLDRARRLLLAGQRPASVAVAVGFHDQAHLHRHFVRHLGTTPGRYAGRDATA
ncbi:AraC family transcriptional regulator [Micromonospora sp. WMMD1102]|uniref:AraC family transcriptional regulator n=1 Tax=Micromonospora sp. WMMD1102 TaxID=3016105 RepID=UPI0024156894|nr:AraC family transcriptional regulator [Micromonospora sp. WMMD1102]MDG4786495.1 AraC family transcriptional regulator [Micromonospora sp. WMMD1102]